MSLSAGTAAGRAKAAGPAKKAPKTTAAEGKPGPAKNRPIPEMSRDEVVLEHLPLVRAIAARVRENLPVQVELDDLVHAGILGLFDAVKKYNPEKNVVFHLYAKHRIRGAILDSLRQLDWASRDLRKRHKSIESTSQQLAQRLGRAPSDSEVADALGVSEGQFRKHRQELHAAGLMAPQPHRVEPPEYAGYGEAADTTEDRPDQVYAQRELRHVLDGAVATLPPRYQRVIQMYYDQENTMKQIGAELGVNESRVSQIHKTALEKLAAALRERGFHTSTEFIEDVREI